MQQCEILRSNLQEFSPITESERPRYEEKTKVVSHAIVIVCNVIVLKKNNVCYTIYLVFNMCKIYFI